ncbi:hypothetical protein PUNSTDRAFT_86711 [Punctularia strigosozonata HHB-11173 SS5]|uniref:uncharacterized protein n=1 Tax=Punctularia strigosozonata (strain HHB-11173) TaxID=741275 RepID=UPI0004416C8A|nr:uncharacterized protein PUNSTDRAFT_86711 [Punctularia strigosozonata HHB-11173 SS5]EIN08707.1 hypothetical protein PUNSTDRAFT_86711 [Punctularia strigosozonata HHB-11173 SS5]
MTRGRRNGPRGPPTRREIYDVAQVAANIFEDHGLPVCLFGSTACALWGIDRRPNDVDMVVMTDQYDSEELKYMLVNEDGSFYLVPSANPRNNYEVLWYTLRSARNAERRACKVDILLPGTMDIPWIPTPRVVYRHPFGVEDIRSLPVMPLEPLLLLKLQGWSDHLASPRMDFQEKVHTDADDIAQLVEICVDAGVKPHKAKWLDFDFRKKGLERVHDFADAYPEVWGWAELGYRVYG